MKNSNDTIGNRTRDLWKKYRGLKFSSFFFFFFLIEKFYSVRCQSLSVVHCPFPDCGVVFMQLVSCSEPHDLTCLVWQWSLAVGLARVTRGSHT